MTWKELKEAIDRLLAEKGISQDTPVELIELHFPNKDLIYIDIDADDGDITIL